MKRSLLAAAALLLLATAQAQAELPKCGDSQVKETFLNVARPWQVLEIKDWRGTDDKRWCDAYYIGKSGMGSPYMEAIFTLEWINDQDNRFWLQIRQSQQTCRGVMGNPWSMERCPFSETDGRHARGAIISNLYHTACEKLPDEVVSGVEAAKKEISQAALDSALRDIEQEIREGGVAKFCARYKANIDKASAYLKENSAR